MGYYELLLVLLGLSLIALESSAISIEPKESLLLYRKGSSVTLVCETNSTEKSTSLQWTAPPGFNSQKTEQFDGSVYYLTETLKISVFDFSQVGNYTCEHRKKDDTSLGSITKTLKIVTESKEDYHFYTTARLSCQIDLPNIVNVKWLQKSTFITDLKDSETHFKEENTTLIINKPERKQAGLYIARFTMSDRKDAYDCEVYFTAAPFVEDFEKAKNLIQNDNMELLCKVQGYPHAVVTWFKDNVPLNMTAQGDRIVMSTLLGYRNARLQIKNVQFEDAGEYKCEAYSKLFNLSSHKAVTVRVKGLELTGGRNHPDDKSKTIKHVRSGGAASDDQRLQPGVEITSIDSTSVAGMTSEEAELLLQRAFSHKNPTNLGIHIRHKHLI